MRDDSGASEETSAQVDVAIVGAGPAGRSLAAALVERRCRVAIVDPAIESGWENTYGVWLDEIGDGAEEILFRGQWDEATVHTGARIELQRRYGCIDNQRWRRRLDETLHGGDALFISERVEEVDVGDRRSVVVLASGTRLEATVVVDASGGRAKLVETEPAGTIGFQRAYGIHARFDGDPLDGSPMVLMDYRPIPGIHESAGTPTFLYGMRFDDGTVFAEETVLVDADPTPFDVLRRRLHRRVGAAGAELVEVYDTEECHIPMGTPLPTRDSRVIGFGAAAGLVHPATGYQIGRMLNCVGDVADAISEALEAGDAPEQIAGAAHRRLWPDELRRARQLLMFGRDVIMGLEPPMVRRFFDTFFRLGGRQWRDYLRGDTDPGRIAAIMWRLFRQADSSLKWALTVDALGDVGRLLRSLAPDSRTPGGVPPSGAGGADG